MVCSFRIHIICIIKLWYASHIIVFIEVGKISPQRTIVSVESIFNMFSILLRAAIIKM